MSHCWLHGVDGSGFSLANLPLGVADVQGTGHVCVRLGDHVLDLHRAAADDHFEAPLVDALLQPRINELMELGRAKWSSLRHRIVQLLTDADKRATVEPHLVPANALSMLMPFEVADYVDFYSSEHHAKNVSEIFGPDAPYLPEHWHHMPIAYHGRAGTVVPSGTPIRRPHGQRRPSDQINPTYGPSRRLDI